MIICFVFAEISVLVKFYEIRSGPIKLLNLASTPSTLRIDYCKSFRNFERKRLFLNRGLETRNQISMSVSDCAMIECREFV